MASSTVSGAPLLWALSGIGPRLSCSTAADLNGSQPRRGDGLAVIAAESHLPDYQPPPGWEWTGERAHSGLRRVGETGGSYTDFDIPGCVPLYAEPGDLLLCLPHARSTQPVPSRRTSLTYVIPWASSVYALLTVCKGSKRAAGGL